MGIDLIRERVTRRFETRTTTASKHKGVQQSKRNENISREGMNRTAIDFASTVPVKRGFQTRTRTASKRVHLKRGDESQTADVLFVMVANCMRITPLRRRTLQPNRNDDNNGRTAYCMGLLKSQR